MPGMFDGGSTGGAAEAQIAIAGFFNIGEASGTFDRQMPDGVPDFKVCRPCVNLIISAAGMDRCGERADRDCVVPSLGVDGAAEADGDDSVVTVVGIILAGEKIPDRPERAFDLFSYAAHLLRLFFDAARSRPAT